MVTAYINVWKRCTDFSGRTSRKEYWLTVASNMVIAIVLGAVLGVISVIGAFIHEDLGNLLLWIQNLILWGYSLAFSLASISLCVRRLHDQDKAGIIYLFCALGSLCCCIGSIAWIVLACMPGTPGPNQYGPNPNGMGGGNMYGGQNMYNQNMYGQNNYGQGNSGQNNYGQR